MSKDFSSEILIKCTALRSSGISYSIKAKLDMIAWVKQRRMKFALSPGLFDDKPWLRNPRRGILSTYIGKKEINPTLSLRG